jgi:hypothetical protein
MIMTILIIVMSKFASALTITLALILTLILTLTGKRKPKRLYAPLLESHALSTSFSLYGRCHDIVVILGSELV